MGLHMTTASHASAQRRPLAELLRSWLDEHSIRSERQVALRCKLSEPTWRSIRSGRVVRPKQETLEKISKGTGIPLRKLMVAAARNVDASYVIDDVTEQLDITSPQALDIFIARLGEVPDEDLPMLRSRVQEIVDLMLLPDER